uniref:Uncharacterized protein n=1 Tax=Arundo donax TaxID=35708 RepID=A0A0A9HA15_ARUDO
MLFAQTKTALNVDAKSMGSIVKKRWHSETN